MTDTLRVTDARLRHIDKILRQNGLRGDGPPLRVHEPCNAPFWSDLAYSKHLDHCLQECGICGVRIRGGLNEFNRHIWKCSRHRTRGTTSTGPA